MFSIFSLIEIKAPLPSMSGWSISPDLMKIIGNTIIEEKPKVILECGSGTSTIVSGYLLNNLNPI